MKQTFNIDKMLLLEATDGGRDFFLFVLPDLKPRGGNGFENTFNPFYDDTKPSLSTVMAFSHIGLMLIVFV